MSRRPPLESLDLETECHACGSQNLAHGTCLGCGASLEGFCGSCGAERPSGGSFCTRCGEPFEWAPEPLAPSPTRGDSPDSGERRHLTVMFCDLVESTQLSELLDPEDLRDVVRSYQLATAEVVQHYSGHVAQFLGDGVMVYFGYPHWRAGSRIE